ncbi:MAG: hypothetical protein COB02_16590 [Candidatus Cloacimonadota bacterium]|nr:MAG: hypothetical protein COB02_16590 [Candidatus Cloacimonadota bacterium]
MEKLTVLIIDDQLYVRKTLHELLEILYPDASIYSAENDDEALSLAKKYQPHLITLDLTMPGLGGKGLCPKLLELSLSSHVYVMSALSSYSVQDEMRALGAKGFIAKPVKLAVLKETVDLVIKSL